jgi:putative pyruvate formate lyase activating enzyme
MPEGERPHARFPQTLGPIADFARSLCARGSRVSSHFHHTGEELFYRGPQGSGTIFFTSCNMRYAFCQNGDISTDKDNGEETDPRTLAAMAWTLRHEGCHNINWVGGEVVIHLHAIVDAIALLGREFTPTPAELKRARKTKADRFFWFDEVPGAATYEGKFNTPMLWNSNFFMTLESMNILRVLTDVWQSRRGQLDVANAGRLWPRGVVPHLRC